mgnify:CR=1 FL=1|tara:strand:+ start:8893 stop:9093 length:201 start_codon:yes stop_codon:yes gene_type:complete
MYKLYKYDGHYIQGELVSKHSSESAALKAAKKKLNFNTATKSNIVKPKVIWLDDKNHTPIGLITIK